MAAVFRFPVGPAQVDVVLGDVDVVVDVETSVDVEVEL